MNGQALFGASAIPLIVGLVQIYKASGFPVRLSPAVALILGVATGLLSVWQTTASRGTIPWAAGLVLGLTWGLGASGLYEAGRQTGVTLSSNSAGAYPSVAAARSTEGAAPEGATGPHQGLGPLPSKPKA